MADDQAAAYQHLQDDIQNKLHHDLWSQITGQSAAWDQQQAARRAMDQWQGNYNQSRQDQMPWLRAGQHSLADLMRQMNSGAFNVNMRPQDIASDPGYQFQMQQGQQALERSAAARGGLNGGGFMKALDRYSQGLASTGYQNAWQRQMSEKQAAFGRLADLAGVGQGAAQNMGMQGGNYSNAMASLYGAQGNAQAAGDSAVPRFLGNAAGTIAGFAAGMPGAGSGFGNMLYGQGAGSSSGFGGYNPSQYSLIPTQDQGMPHF